MPGSGPGPAHRGRRSKGGRALLLAPVPLFAMAGVLACVWAHRTPAPPAPLPRSTFSLALPQARKPKGPDLATAMMLPDHVYIPSLGIAAPYVPLTSDGTVVEPPYWPQVAGWDTLTAPVDSSRGTTLLTSHVNYAGRGAGAFAPLYKIKPLADVYVTDAAGRVTHWEVVRMTDPMKAGGIDQSIFSAAGPRRLALVTCGGSVINGQYQRNVIAYALSGQAGQ